MDFASHCIGTFAVAIWNENDRKLILVSDHVASRCLYYARKADKIYFSTILSPIVKCLENPQINELYMKDFLLSDGVKIYTAPGETYVKDIFLMRPANVMQFVGQKENGTNYWKLSQLKSGEVVSAKDVICNFMHIYEKCVHDATRTNILVFRK